MQRWMADGPLAGQYAPESRIDMYAGHRAALGIEPCLEFHTKDGVHRYEPTRDITMSDPPAIIYRYVAPTEEG